MLQTQRHGVMVVGSERLSEEVRRAEDSLRFRGRSPIARPRRRCGPASTWSKIGQPGHSKGVQLPLPRGCPGLRPYQCFAAKFAGKPHACMSHRLKTKLQRVHTFGGLGPA